MTERTPTPNVMESLMGTTAIKQENNIAVKEEGNRAIKQPTHKAINPVSNKAILTQLHIDGTEEVVAKVEEELKEKATFNLSVKLLEELEDKCHEIRKLASSKQITKTLMVEEALKMALAEFDLKKHTSKFYSKLVSNKTIKQ